MSGEGMSERMGMGGRRRTMIEEAPDVALPQPVASLVQEHDVGWGVGPLEPDPAPLEVPANGIDRRLAERHLPHFRSLAQYRHRRLAQVEIVVAEPAELGHPQPAAVEQL